MFSAYVNEEAWVKSVPPKVVTHRVFDAHRVFDCFNVVGIRRLRGYYASQSSKYKVAAYPLRGNH